MYVYLFGRRDGAAQKIGFSADPARRLRDFDHPPGSLSLLHTIRTIRPVWVEQAMHKAFWHCRIAREWFCLSPDAVALFRSIAECHCAADLPTWAREMIRANILRCRATARGHGRPARKNLTAARFLAGLTPARLGRLVGLSDITITAIEAGNHHTTPERWRAIAAALGEPAEKLSEILP